MTLNLYQNKVSIQTRKNIITGLLIFIGLIISSTTISAKEYKVEVLIFENIEKHTAYESYQYTTPEEQLSKEKTWFLEPTMLIDQAELIQTSDAYKLLHHLSWGQESLPLSESAIQNVYEDDISGWFRIYANELLFANLDLDYLGYRLVEKRRLKLDEQHFFDHPKFGILLQVSRLEVEELEEDVEADLKP